MEEVKVITTLTNLLQLLQICQVLNCGAKVRHLLLEKHQINKNDFSFILGKRI